MFTATILYQADIELAVADAELYEDAVQQALDSMPEDYREAAADCDLLVTSDKGAIASISMPLTAALLVYNFTS